MHVIIQTPPLPPSAPLPTPPPGLDPNLAWQQVLEWVGPIAVMVVIGLGLRWLFRSPVGEALADWIRSYRQPGTKQITGAGGERVAALEAQVAALQGEVAELAERLDFAERVLADRRGQKLGAGQ
ncbi:MAG: hypothetical protein ACREL9_01875 [Gemmatimonadales bacterium]